MSDVIDQANDAADTFLDAAIRNTARPLAVGESGECEECGDWSPRLVRQVCAGCRDMLRLA